METKENIKHFDLIVPAKDLLDAITISADAYSKQPMNEDRARNMKLVLGFLNAYLRAFHTKIGYFKLTGIPEKVKAVKVFSKRLSK